MLLTDQHPHNKHIMVSVLGRTNAGKSTLINTLLGFDLSIVSSKAQTTRNHFHCAFTVDKTEIVLVDTPGVHASGQELNKRMNGEVHFASEGVDLNLLLLDLRDNPISSVKEFIRDFGKDLTKTWIVFTKLDLVDELSIDFDTVVKEIQEILPSVTDYFAISSKEDTNLHLLTGALCDEAVPGPHLYPHGEVSNKTERFFASEYIREQIFIHLKDELPYEVAVVIEEYQDARAYGHEKIDAKISASILVNRPSQRAIVVGKKGSIIKEIGIGARKKIEAMVGGKVHLNLHVKVSPKWFKNNFVLEEIGLPRTETSARVWRKR